MDGVPSTRLKSELENGNLMYSLPMGSWPTRKTPVVLFIVA
ncbi:hypothetical protein [Cytobacillus oceanisediminis]|nr:hypothetical protein [Cytobacillus oceanisediminis]